MVRKRAFWPALAAIVLALAASCPKDGDVSGSEEQSTQSFASAESETASVEEALEVTDDVQEARVHVLHAGSRDGAAEVEGSAPVDGSFEVLIVGAGFESEEELAGFRYASDLLVETVLAVVEQRLGSEYLEVLTILRLDVIGSAGLGESQKFARSGDRFPSIGSAPVLAGTGDAVRRDIGLVLPVSGGSKMWVDDEGAIEELASELAVSRADEIDSIDSIVVIANLDLDAGAAEYSGVGVNVAVSGLKTERVESDGGASVEATERGRFVLFHEYLHTMGLFDEYYSSSVSGEELDAFWDPCRNVYKGDPELDDAGKWLPSPPPVWAGETRCSDYEICVGGAERSCPAWIREYGLEYALTCGSTGEVGLWEGAFYRDTGHFRATFDKCVMGSEREVPGASDAESPLCVACLTMLKRDLCAYFGEGAGPVECEGMEDLWECS